MNGTVKIGRWTYPARKQGGEVSRNTKRDGSGEWVLTDPAKFKADTNEPVIEGFTPEDRDHDDLRVAFLAVFDSADGLTVPQLAEAVGTDDARRAGDLARTLYHLGLTLSDNGVVRPAAGSLQVTRSQVVDAFRAAVPVGTTLVQSAKGNGVGHGGKPGAQTHKPGKSTWQVGDACPRGIHTLTEESIYVMPSGRKQCRDCRRGYGSNRSGAAS